MYHKGEQLLGETDKRLITIANVWNWGKFRDISMFGDECQMWKFSGEGEVLFTLDEGVLLQIYTLFMGRLHVFMLTKKTQSISGGARVFPPDFIWYLANIPGTDCFSQMIAGIFTIGMGKPPIHKGIPWTSFLIVLDESEGVPLLS